MMQEIIEIIELKQKILNEEIVLLFIKSKNCSVCDAVFVQYGTFLNELRNVNKYYVSTEKVPSVAGEYLIFTAPTILLFINGKEVERQSRFVSFEKLSAQIERYMEK